MVINWATHQHASPIDNPPSVALASRIDEAQCSGASCDEERIMKEKIQVSKRYSEGYLSET